MFELCHLAHAACLLVFALVIGAYIEANEEIDPLPVFH